MATLDWQCRHAGDATLVELLVTSDVDERVEIASNLQPVWPPRRQNRPAAGWDESGFEGVVTAGEPLVLGYASPGDPVEPPATVVETEPVAETSEPPPTPEALVRELGEAGPPRDAVPTPPESTAPDAPQATDSTAPTADTSTSSTSPADDTPAAGHSSPADDTPAASSTSPADDTPSTARSSANGQHPSGEQASSNGQHSSREQASSNGQHPSGEQASRAGQSPTGGQQSRAGQSPTGGQQSRAGTPSTGRSSGADRRTADTAPGDAIDAWLGAVERRIETAERLAAVETAEEARAAVDAAGGIAAVRAVCEQLDADRERFERIESDRAAVGERLAAVDVPLSTLERLV